MDMFKMVVPMTKINMFSTFQKLILTIQKVKYKTKNYQNLNSESDDQNEEEKTSNFLNKFQN